MGEINIKFRMTVDDILEFNNTVIHRNSKILAVINIAFLGFVLIQNIREEEKSYTFIAFTAIAIALLIFLLCRKKYISKRNFEKQFKNYFLLKTETVMEFYNDHIVQKNEGGETGIKFEDHIPLEAIKTVTETKEHYLFFISPIESFIVPKRALNEEDKVKMNNLIQNAFNDRHITQ